MSILHTADTCMWSTPIILSRVTFDLYTAIILSSNMSQVIESIAFVHPLRSEVESCFFRWLGAFSVRPIDCESSGLRTASWYLRFPCCCTWHRLCLHLNDFCERRAVLVATERICQNWEMFERLWSGERIILTSHRWLPNIKRWLGNRFPMQFCWHGKLSTVIDSVASWAKPAPTIYFRLQ